MKPVQAVALAKVPNIFHRIERYGASPTNPDEFLHGLHALFPPAEVALAHRFPHQFRDGSLAAPGAGVKRVPDGVIEIQLRSPHDV